MTFDFPFTVNVKRHIYVDPITVKQENYIKDICAYYDMESPSIYTKDEASAWLDKFVPKFKLDRECNGSKALGKLALCLCECEAVPF